MDRVKASRKENKMEEEKQASCYSNLPVAPLKSNEIYKRKVKERREEEEGNTSQRNDVRSNEIEVKNGEKEEIMKDGEEESRKQRSEAENSDVTRLNELMITAIKLQAAPKVNIDSFKGYPLEYIYFLETIKDSVESLVDNPK